jgi:predicted N-acyltransferase
MRSIKIFKSMAEVPRKEWDALAQPIGNPLLSWGFLSLLEESGSIGPETGWHPFHFALMEGGTPVAAAPFYAKTFWGGEFIYDFAFSEYAEKIGSKWYPKLVGMVPASPCPAWRILAKEGPDRSDPAQSLLASAREAAREAKFGGIHIQWADTDASPRLVSSLPDEEGTAFRTWLHRTSLWTNRGYRDFSDFLDSMGKNMRRNVKRDRTAVAAAGIRTRAIEPEEARADPGILSSMADFYEDTNDRFGPWGAKFLTREFFARLPEFLESGWFLSAAFDAGSESPVALAFLLEGRENIYGRYWGTSRFADGLHFELCYYLPIERAIRKGIKYFDPGYGGEHKARRGFASVLAPSYHLAFDPRMDAVLAASFPAANEEEREQAKAYDAQLPFKENDRHASPPSPNGGESNRVK